jgi:hypothetical protein
MQGGIIPTPRGGQFSQSHIVARKCDEIIKYVKKRSLAMENKIVKSKFTVRI